MSTGELTYFFARMRHTTFVLFAFVCVFLLQVLVSCSSLRNGLTRSRLPKPPTKLVEGLLQIVHLDKSGKKADVLVLI